MSINWTLLDEASYKDLRYDLLLAVEETNDPKEEAYSDAAPKAGIPTIGIGFNLQANLRAVLEAGFGWVDNPDNPTNFGANGYMERIAKKLEGLKTPAQLEAAIIAIDAILAERAADPRLAPDEDRRTHFGFGNEAEVRATFDALIDDKYDIGGAVDAWMPNIPLSRERAVLASLAYNGKAKDKDSPATPLAGRPDLKPIGQRFMDCPSERRSRRSVVRDPV